MPEDQEYRADDREMGEDDGDQHIAEDYAEVERREPARRTPMDGKKPRKGEVDQSVIQVGSD